MMRQSAGILMYRFRNGALEVLLAHPGGPLWEGRDAGAWTIPKGLFDDDESALDAARREFEEETGFAVDGEFLSLGDITLRSGKRVHVWAVEGDLDADEIASNLFTMEWPKGSGRMRDFPEVDRGEWFGLETARRKIFETQLPFLERLVAALFPEGGR
jgi:predicted NUDIX family NTP pyrophosphohydrolase